MQPVLTITTNPAVDLAMSVPEVVAGPKLRCVEPRWDPGGGGVNVARAIKKLGGEATALFAAGGAMGDRLLSLLAAENVKCLPISVTADTRISFAVTEEASGDQFRFGLPGEDLSAKEGARLLQSIEDASQGAPYAVFSGSVAPGLPASFVAEIQKTLMKQSAKLIVDTSSAALDYLLSHPLRIPVLRVDQREGNSAAKRQLKTLEDCKTFAKSLVENGVAECVIMGRGADGSILVSQNEYLHAWGPTVPVRSKVGAGDTFVGAFSFSLARGEPFDVALKWGVAGAAATVSTEGTALCRKNDAEAIFAQSQVRQF